MNFHIVTFGCQMNANDSDWLARALIERGFTPTGPEDADVVILNTCSVREKPELKVYSELGRIKRFLDERPGAFAAVGGCVAQQIGAGFFGRFPFVRLVFGTDGTAHAPRAIERLLQERDLRISLIDFTAAYPERDPALDTAPAPGAQAFVTIMQGCDNYCAYCIVPYTRGRQKSRAAAAVLAECRRLVELGARQITLLGQNVNSYGLDKHGDGTTFAELLRGVAAIDGLDRLRFTTSHPKDIADEVIAAFGELPTLCPHLHLPLQSGSDRILKAMGRRYDMARYLSIVERLRAARPDIALGTDLIVGFPGETDADFEQTLDAMRTVRFESSFSFRYSDRPGTRAARLPVKVPEEVAADRLLRLQALQDGFTSEALAHMVGRDIAVLVEGPSKKSAPNIHGRAAATGGATSWRGHDPYNHVVNVVCAASGDRTGTTVRAHVREAKKHSLLATER